MSLQEVKDIVEIAQAALTSMAILAAAVWTYLLFVKKRQRYPRTKVQHDVQHLPISKDEIQLRVIVKISNAGEVLLPLESVFVRLQQILPWRNDAMGTIDQAREQLTAKTCELDWPVLSERTSEWCRGEQEIEPAEEDEVIFDFIVDRSVGSVSVYSYVKNAYKKRYLIRFWRTREIGWNTTTIHPLEEKEINMIASSQRQGVPKSPPKQVPAQGPPTPRPAPRPSTPIPNEQGPRKEPPPPPKK